MCDSQRESDGAWPQCPPLGSVWPAPLSHLIMSDKRWRHCCRKELTRVWSSASRVEEFAHSLETDSAVSEAEPPETCQAQNSDLAEVLV